MYILIKRTEVTIRHHLISYGNAMNHGHCYRHCPSVLKEGLFYHKKSQPDVWKCAIVQAKHNCSCTSLIVRKSQSYYSLSSGSSGWLTFHIMYLSAMPKLKLQYKIFSFPDRCDVALCNLNPFCVSSKHKACHCFHSCTTHRIIIKIISRVNGANGKVDSDSSFQPWTNLPKKRLRKINSNKCHDCFALFIWHSFLLRSLHFTNWPFQKKIYISF